MAWNILPSLILGWGDSGERILDESALEISEFEPDLIQKYLLYRFTSINIKLPTLIESKNGWEKIGFSTEQEYKERRKWILDKLFDKLKDLQTVRLPLEEDRYEIPGTEAKTPRIATIFIISNLAEDTSDLFVSDFLPSFLEKLKAKRPPNYRLCFFLSIAVFDNKDAKAKVEERLTSFNQLIDEEEVKDKFLPRIYLVSKHPSSGTPGVSAGIPLKQVEQAEELLGLFLQNLLLSNLGPANRFLIQSRKESTPYLTVGMAVADFPTFQLIDYCTKKELCLLAKEILKERESSYFEDGKTWAESCDLSSLIPISEIPPPTFDKTSFNISTPDYEIKNSIEENIRQWEKGITVWFEERLQELKRQSIKIKKESISKFLQTKIDLDNVLSTIISKKFGFYLFKQYIEGIIEKLNFKKQRFQKPIWSVIEKPPFDEILSLKKKLFKLIDKKPIYKSFIFHAYILFILGFTFLIPILFHFYGIFKATLGAITILLIIELFIIYIILVFSHLKIKMNYNKLVKKIKHYPIFANENLNNCLSNISYEYELKNLSLIGKTVESYKNKIDLVRELINWKCFSEKEGFSKETIEIEHLTLKVVRNTNFRQYIAREEAFPEIFRQQDIDINKLLGEFDERFGNFDKIIKLSPYKFFEEIYEFIQAKFSNIKFNDYFGRQFNEEVKKYLERSFAQIPFYIVLAPETLGKVDSKIFFFSNEVYKDMINKLHSQDYSIIEFKRYNRVFLCKIMWGITFNSIRVWD